MPSYTQYMRQMAVLDAKDDDIESWITVKGNHIPIKKGQSKEDAVKSFIESKGGSGEKKPEKSKALKEAERSAKWWAKEDPKGMVGIYAREMKETVKELRKIEGKDPNSPEYQTALARAKRQVKAWRDEAKMNKGLGMTGIMARERKDIYNELKKAGSSEKKEETPADLEKRASAIGLKPGVKVQFADGTIKEVVGVRSDLVDLKKNDGKVGAHTLYPLEKGIKNGEIKVLNGNEYKADAEKKAPNGQTIAQLRESGKDVEKLDKAMQYVHYGFKEEKGNKMSPQQLLDFLEERVKESDKDKNFGDRWAKSRFPEAIKLVKEYINGTGKK